MPRREGGQGGWRVAPRETPLEDRIAWAGGFPWPPIHAGGGLDGATSVLRGELALAEGQQVTPAQGPGEQLRQITGLVAAVDGAEHQFDRPLGGDALGLQRVGQA